MHWRRKWQPTSVLLPGESQGWRSLVHCHLYGGTESDTTEATQQQTMLYMSSHICVVVYTQTIHDLVDFQGSFLAIYHLLLVFIVQETVQCNQGIQDRSIVKCQWDRNSLLYNPVLIEYSSIKKLFYVCDVPCDIHVTTHVSIHVTISIHVTTQYLRYDQCD